MKAIVYTKYGTPDDLKLTEVEQPVPKDDEVLIRVYAVSVNRSDWEMLVGRPLYARFGGLLKPGRSILGSDIAGRVESVGSRHQPFRPGDEVYGDILGVLGGFAEYACARGGVMALKPAGLSFEQVSTIPQPGMIALQALRDKGQVQPGQTVLINGAGGATGTFAIQLAKLYGAEVTGVDNSGKLEYMRSLGAQHVIDYTQEDFTRSGKQYDLVLDLVAYRPAAAYRRALKPGGMYLFVGGSVATLLQILFLGPWIRRATGKNIRFLAVQPNREDLVSFTELCVSGKIAPVIDRSYPLSEAPEALRRLGAGQVKGKIVITVQPENKH